MLRSPRHKKLLVLVLPSDLNIDAIRLSFSLSGICLFQGHSNCATEPSTLLHTHAPTHSPYPTFWHSHKSILHGALNRVPPLHHRYLGQMSSMTTSKWPQFCPIRARPCLANLHILSRGDTTKPNAGSKQLSVGAGGKTRATASVILKLVLEEPERVHRV